VVNHHWLFELHPVAEVHFTPDKDLAAEVGDELGSGHGK
jgi:hypothetical protein